MRVLRIFVRVAHLRSAQAIVGCTQRPITFADFYFCVVARFQGDNLSMDRFIDPLLLRAIITRQAHARTLSVVRSFMRNHHGGYRGKIIAVFITSSLSFIV